jgi:hypothetical protein
MEKRTAREKAIERYLADLTAATMTGKGKLLTAPLGLTEREYIQAMARHLDMGHSKEFRH